MYIIMSRTNRWRWVSGVFRQEQDAHRYYDTISGPVNANHEIVHTDVLSYPLYFIETFPHDQPGLFEYIFFSKDTIPDYFLKCIQSNVLGEEETLFNLYVIDGDFIPEKPGADQMGELRHFHVDKEMILSILKKGILQIGKKPRLR